MKKGTIAVLSTLFGAAAGAAGIHYTKEKEVEKKKEKVDKFKGYYNMLNQWLILKQEGKCLCEYFKANHYNTIAIYGMGEMGNRLYEELKDSGITVKYAIDKNAASTYSEIEVIDPDEELEKVDAIVITAIFAFDEIESELSKRMGCPIVSLEDVVYEV